VDAGRERLHLRAAELIAAPPEKPDRTTRFLAAGGRADLLLVNGNPLKDLSNVSKRAGVMWRGRWLGEDEIQKRLESIASSHRPPSSP
jgi:hypothetical protein